jgi:hypothetical protein
MSANLVSDRPASVSLLRILGVLILGYIILGNVVALVTISLLYGDDFLLAMSDPISHPDVRNIMVFAQGLASLVGLVLVPTFYLKSFEHRSTGRFFAGFPSSRWILILSMLVVTLAVGISPLTEWNANVELPSWTGGLGDFLRDFENQAAVLVKAFVSDLTPATFLLVFVVIAVIPAWGEELVFRGLIQTELLRAFRNPHVAIWCSAAIFSAFHMQFFGFVPRLLMGATVGYLYFWSGNLWMPVTFHFLNNGLQVTAIYLMQLKVHTLDVESTESAPLSLVAVSLLLMTGLLYYCRKNLAPVKREPPSALQ